MDAKPQALDRAATRPAFGVDLITFFDPTFWGLADDASLEEFAAADARSFFTRMLDTLERSGISQLELTFAPADFRTAARAFGSAREFHSELNRRGMGVTSSYFGEIEHAADLSAPGLQEQILAEAAGYASFLAEIGARYLVVGLPMRRNAGAGSGYLPVDLHSAAPVADLLNRVGSVTAQYGIRTLLHTESHSIFWTTRDVDLMMLLTDSLLVGLCLDAGHVMLAGSDPVAVARRHRDRLALAHWKDASGAFTGTPAIDETIFTQHRKYFCPVGDGVVDWKAFGAELKNQGFRECILLELDAASDPETALIAARTYLEATLGEELPSFAPPHAPPATITSQE